MEKNILIDFHAHILPEMDHGCNDIAMSMAQLKMAADYKIDRIIATSHFYPHIENVRDFLTRREASWEKLKAVKRIAYPDIKLGAEVLLCSNLDKMEGIESLCIENTKVLLLEMPLIKQWESKLIETLVRLRDEKGIEVIIAHGERYPVKEMGKLLDKGFQMQINVSSAAKLLPSCSVKNYIKENYVTAFGSDIHGLHNSYREFAGAMKRWGVQAERIMEKTHKLLGDG